MNINHVQVPITGFIKVSKELMSNEEVIATFSTKDLASGGLEK